MKFSHRYLLSAVAGELLKLRKERGTSSFRLLEVGCGRGGLLKDLVNWNARLGEAGFQLEIYGSEVYDHRAGMAGYFETLMNQLCPEFPGTDWRANIRLVNASDPWPFEDGFFDLVYSNQVIEHVHDLKHFMFEQRRVLKPRGTTLHFFPSREMCIEPHSGVPFVHWFESNEVRIWWIRAWSRLGIGKFRKFWRCRGRFKKARIRRGGY